MRKGNFLCIGWLPILLCSLVLLVATAFFELRDIEEKVKVSARQALAKDAFGWAKVETYNRGRQVLITGAAPNQAAIDEALRLAGEAYGVLEASHNGEALIPAILIPATLVVRGKFTHTETGTAADKIIELSGALADQTQIELALSQARSVFKDAKVIDALTIVPNTAELPNLDVLSALNQNERSAREFVAEINQDTLKLSGWISSKNASLALQNDVRRTFKGAIDNKIVVRNICQELFDDLLTRGKVNYQTGNATIAESSFALLDQISSAAERCPNTRFEVAGHSDSVGSLNFNTKLSLARAQAVVDYLVNNGLSSQQFTAKGYGPTQPIADNASEEGRARNRRIEFRQSN